MNKAKRISDIEEYMLNEEKRLQIDVRNDLSELYRQRGEIENKYEQKKRDITETCNAERDKIKHLFGQAFLLVDGIHRKLYKKQNRTVKTEQSDTPLEPKMILANLKCEIDRFETSCLPFGIRQLFDSVSLMFNSEYGQAEVDKITGLYQSIEEIKENCDFDKRLNEELSRIDKAQLQEIFSIDKSVADIVNERVDDYIYALNKMIFTA